jgi:hypothetical protein
MADWAVTNRFHDLSKFDPNPRKGRNPREGYIRGCGIQFGNIPQLCQQDADFMRAYEMARPMSIVADANLMNLYMLIRFYLPRLQPGAIAEFGCYKGGSCVFMAYLAKRFLGGAKVYGFDTFVGMPVTDRTIDVHKAGDFADIDLPAMEQHVARLGLDNLHFVKGRFEDSLPDTLPKMGPLALMHIDCDIYGGVEVSYNQAKHSLVPGGYIALDDPLVSSCLGALEAVEDHMIRADGLSAEQVFPHMVFRYPKI